MVQGVMSSEASYYFAHSYFLTDHDPNQVRSVSSFKEVQFPAQVLREGITGFQYHPELSGNQGLRLLREALE
jgi:imidazoleglycerol phosphate synthase glutamine amidotransferase subunit HisH